MRDKIELKCNHIQNFAHNMSPNRRNLYLPFCTGQTMIIVATHSKLNITSYLNFGITQTQPLNLSLLRVQHGPIPKQQPPQQIVHEHESTHSSSSV